MDVLSKIRLKLNRNSTCVIFVLSIYVYLVTSFVLEDGNLKILRPYLNSEVWLNITNWTGMICALCYAVVAYLVPSHNTNKVQCDLIQLQNITLFSTSIFVICIMMYLISMKVPPIFQFVAFFTISFMLNKLTICITQSTEKQCTGSVRSSDYRENVRYARRRSNVNKYRSD